MNNLPEKREIRCCGCGTNVEARLTSGKEIYPHRSDLFNLPFWKCDTCGNFVGCHHKTSDRTRPLGCIPTPEIKALRRQIHARLDPLWQQELMSRRAIYARLTELLGFTYHTAALRTELECNLVLDHLETIWAEVNA